MFFFWDIFTSWNIRTNDVFFFFCFTKSAQLTNLDGFLQKCYLTSILFFDEPKPLGGEEYWHFQEISWTSTRCIREIVVFSWSRFLIYILNLIVLSTLFSLRKKIFFVGIFETWQTKKAPKRSNSGSPKN